MIIEGQTKARIVAFENRLQEIINQEHREFNLSEKEIAISLGVVQYRLAKDLPAAQHSIDMPELGMIHVTITKP